MDFSVGQFLDAHCPVDRIEQYVRMDELMLSFGVEEYETPLLDVVHNAEIYDKDEILDRFHYFADGALRQLCRQHGIILNDDCTFDSALTVVKTLELLNAWVDHPEVLSICNMDGTTEERFCTLVGLTTGADIEEFMWVLDEVDDNLIKQIEQLHSVEGEDEEQSPVFGSDELVASVELVNKFMIGKAKIATRLMSVGYPLGAPIAFYLSLLRRRWQFLTPEEAANELFVLLHMADNTYRNVIMGYAMVSSDIFPDLNTIATVDTLIKRLMGEFSAYRLSQG